MSKCRDICDNFTRTKLSLSRFSKEFTNRANLCVLSATSRSQTRRSFKRLSTDWPNVLILEILDLENNTMFDIQERLTKVEKCVKDKLAEISQREDDEMKVLYESVITYKPSTSKIKDQNKKTQAVQKDGNNNGVNSKPSKVEPKASTSGIETRAKRKLNDTSDLKKMLKKIKKEPQD